MRLRWLRAFTLIEMLVVLAIIGILAGILLPALIIARAKVRVTQAKHDIAQIRSSLMTYSQDYGAYPPDAILNTTDRDATFDGSGTMWPASLSPSECVNWFLTRNYSKDVTVPGCPWNTPNWTPSRSVVQIYSRTSGGPYASWSQKQLRDYDSNTFDEFVDPWGRPYLYRAYPRTYNATAVNGTLTINDSGLACLPRKVGRVRVSGCVSGIFDIGETTTNAALTQVTLTISSSASGAATVQFMLHNPEECDLYSLGPNGLTRNGQAPWPLHGNGMGTEWKPADTTQFNYWTRVWGTPGDGNDCNSQSANPGLASDKDKDDINNWN